MAFNKHSQNLDAFFLCRSGDASSAAAGSPAAAASTSGLITSWMSFFLIAGAFTTTASRSSVGRLRFLPTTAIAAGPLAVARAARRDDSGRFSQ